ncbi:unnamed protein product [Ectocarpus fasciculatus]
MCVFLPNEVLVGGDGMRVFHFLLWSGKFISHSCISGSESINDVFSWCGCSIPLARPLTDGAGCWKDGESRCLDTVGSQLLRSSATLETTGKTNAHHEFYCNFVFCILCLVATPGLASKGGHM